MTPVAARFAAGAAAAGVATIATGTFLPWLRSGAALRNSYQAAAALRPLTQGATATALTIWPAVLPLCGLCVATYALGLRRTAAVTGALVAAATAATAALVLTTEPNALLAPAQTGPTTALTGAVILLTSTTAILTNRKEPPTKRNK